MREIRAAIDALVMSALEYQHAWGASDEASIAQAVEARPDLRPLVELCFARQEGAECLSDREIASELYGGGR